MKLRLAWWAVTTTLLMALAAGTASAHTTSIGFIPGANPGEVEFWAGTYHNCISPPQEGTLTVTGVNGTVYGPVSTAFNIAPVCVKPAGLIDGSNNCYWQSSQSLPLDCTITTDPGVSGGVDTWHGVLFSGLTPGDYEFTCGNNCGSTFFWETWNNSSNTLTITAADIGSNTEPVPTLSTISLAVLIALIITGMFWSRRRYLT